ncbi:unnamed protein product, partial [Prorocentrum cordatum]
AAAGVARGGGPQLALALPGPTLQAPCTARAVAEAPTPMIHSTGCRFQAQEDRLMNLFAFVGITEKWDLSICLFNAKYNNPCKSNQFDSSFHVNSTTEAHGWYDTDALDGFVDKYDGRLYDRALQMFEEDLVRFGVSEENCNRCVD